MSKICFQILNYLIFASIQDPKNFYIPHVHKKVYQYSHINRNTKNLQGKLKTGQIKLC